MRCCGSPQNICRPNATKMRCCEAARHRLCPPSATCLQNSCHKMRKKWKQKDTIPIFLSSHLSIDKSHWHCQKSNQYISWVTPCSIILSPYIQTLSQWPWIWNNGKSKKHPHHSLNSCPTENHHLWHPKSTVEPFSNTHKQTNKHNIPISSFVVPPFLAKICGQPIHYLTTQDKVFGLIVKISIFSNGFTVCYVPL